MSRPIWLIAGVVLACIVAGGCVSAPRTRYYTLDMQHGGHAAPKYNVDVSRLRASEALGRRDILVHLSRTEVEYYGDAQWSAGVSELVQQKLEAEFGPVDLSRPSLVAEGIVLQFGQVEGPGPPGARAELALSIWWEGSSRYDIPVVKKTYSCDSPTEKTDPAGIAQSLSDCLEEIAAQIAADVNELQPPDEPNNAGK